MTAQLPCSFDIDESEKKLKICIVYSRNPFPMMRGDQLTVSHLISFLSARGHSLDLLTLDIGGDIQPDQRKWLDENCNNAYRIKHNYLDMFYGLVRGLIKALPMQVAIFNNSKQERLLKSLDLKNNYDVVYTYYLRSAEISKMFKGKNVLAMQLSQTLNTRRIRDNTDSRIKKIIYSLEAFLIERYEGVIWKSFRNVALIGEKDLESMEAVSEKYSGEKISNWFYSAHGTDILKFQPANECDVVKNRMVFSGSMLYEPNVQAVLWFVKKCWPSIKREVESVEFYIVGRDPVKEILDLNKHLGITVTGTVADPGEYIRTAAVCINPVQAAGGMQNKLIEYMASKKIIVCTSIANEGIKAPMDSVIIADNPQEFILNVINVLKNPDSYNYMASNARTYVESFWTWDYHFLKLEKKLMELNK